MTEKDLEGPVRSCSVRFVTERGITETELSFFGHVIRLITSYGMRPGVVYKVKIEDPVDRADPETGLTERTARAMVALESHTDAEIGEWAIFEGDRRSDLPVTAVTSPTRGNELRYFGNPKRFGEIVVYQRITTSEYISLGGAYVNAQSDKNDEAAAMRA